MVFGSTKLSLRGGDQSIPSNPPKFEVTDASPMSSTSGPGIGVDARRAVLSAVTLNKQLAQNHAELVEPVLSMRTSERDLSECERLAVVCLCHFWMS